MHKITEGYVVHRDGSVEKIVLGPGSAYDDGWIHYKGNTFSVFKDFFPIISNGELKNMLETQIIPRLVEGLEEASERLEYLNEIPEDKRNNPYDEIDFMEKTKKGLDQEGIIKRMQNLFLLSPVATNIIANMALPPKAKTSQQKRTYAERSRAIRDDIRGRVIFQSSLRDETLDDLEDLVNNPTPEPGNDE